MIHNAPKPKIYTAETFSLEVEEVFLKEKGRLTYLEVATDLMRVHNIDPEDGASMISPTLKAKIAAQSRERNLLKEKTKTVKLV